MNYKYSLKSCQKIAEENGGQCLSDRFFHVKDKIKWKCSNNHTFEKSLDLVIRRCFCAQCSSEKSDKKYTIEIINKIEKIHNIIHIGTEKRFLTEKTEWKYSCGVDFIKTPDIINAKKRAHVPCILKPKKPIHNRKTIQHCHDVALKHNGKCLDTEYKGVFFKYNWQCHKNHTWKASASNTTKGHWCPYCPNKTEEKCRIIFEKLFDKKFPKIKPIWLRNSATNKLLELDGFCEELSLAFEYDGEYHFMPHFKNINYKVDRRNRCDNLKDRICLDKGIFLIRIPYTKKANLEDFIINKLIKGGFMLIKYSCNCCDNSITKFYQNNKDIVPFLDCGGCNVGKLERQLGAPSSKHTQFVDNGGLTNPVEIMDEVLENESLKSQKED